MESTNLALGPLCLNAENNSFRIVLSLQKINGSLHGLTTHCQTFFPDGRIERTLGNYFTLPDYNERSLLRKAYDDFNYRVTMCLLDYKLAPNQWMTDTSFITIT